MQNLELKDNDLQNQIQAQTTDLNHKLKQFQKFMMEKQGNQNQEIAFMRKQVGIISADQANVNTYLNKILPMKNYSAMVNMMHIVLNNKDDLANLKDYESMIKNKMIDLFNLNEYIESQNERKNR